MGQYNEYKPPEHISYRRILRAVQEEIETALGEQDPEQRRIILTGAAALCEGALMKGSLS